MTTLGRWLESRPSAARRAARHRRRPRRGHALRPGAGRADPRRRARGDRRPVDGARRRDRRPPGRGRGSVHASRVAGGGVRDGRAATAPGPASTGARTSRTAARPGLGPDRDRHLCVGDRPPCQPRRLRGAGHHDRARRAGASGRHARPVRDGHRDLAVRAGRCRSPVPTSSWRSCCAKGRTRRLAAEWDAAETDLLTAADLARALGDVVAEAEATLLMAHMTWDPVRWSGTLADRLESLLDQAATGRGDGPGPRPGVSRRRHLSGRGDRRGPAFDRASPGPPRVSSISSRPAMRPRS